MAEPDKVLIEFTDKLPVTIKDVLLLRCCLGIEGFDVVKDRDYPAILRRLLDSLYGFTKTYRCAMLIGAMELALEREEGDEQLYQKLWQEHEEPLFRDMSLRVPLRDRHWQNARKEFYALRRGPLSPKALRKWQTHLLVKSRI